MTTSDWDRAAAVGVQVEFAGEPAPRAAQALTPKHHLHQAADHAVPRSLVLAYCLLDPL
ncbi:hypothetical protein [Streptomyces pristinaespiralis]|uniref:hypothetical protein n=1 Tax=Streptomyces pristinaespiralis TaxID=38300 RepID=UPI003837061C